MPAPGAGGVQTSLVGTVQGMMASARAAFRRKPPPEQRRGAPVQSPGGDKNNPADLSQFAEDFERSREVAWSDLDPVYFDSSYYLYPDGPVAVEMLRVIGAAMSEAPRGKEGEDGAGSAPAGSLAARSRGSETESTDCRRAHHSRPKAAQTSNCLIRTPFLRHLSRRVVRVEIGQKPGVRGTGSSN